MNFNRSDLTNFTSLGDIELYDYVVSLETKIVIEGLKNTRLIRKQIGYETINCIEHNYTYENSWKIRKNELLLLWNSARKEIQKRELPLPVVSNNILILPKDNQTDKPIEKSVEYEWVAATKQHIDRICQEFDCSPRTLSDWRKHKKQNGKSKIEFIDAANHVFRYSKSGRKTTEYRIEKK